MVKQIFFFISHVVQRSLKNIEDKMSICSNACDPSLCLYKITELNFYLNGLYFCLK